MTRIILFAVMLVASIFIFTPVYAQDQPIVTTSISSTSPLVGQVTTITVKVLVPTWLTKPLYFDEVEAVNLISLKTNKSTYPTSENVNGNMWSGIIKDYTLIPMVSGNFTLNIPSIRVHYMNAANEPVDVQIRPDAVSFSATVPTQAENLKPLIIARQIDIEQSFNVPEKIKVGQSISRTLDVTVEGSSAMFIPPLLTKLDSALGSATVSSYARSPQVSDSMDARSGGVTGTRKEHQDVLLEAAGELNFPPLSLRYYSLTSGEIEEVSVDGKSFTVHGALLTKARSTEKWTLALAYLVMALLFVVFAWRFGRNEWRRWVGSEAYAFRQLVRHCDRPDRATELLLRRWQRHWFDVIADSPILQQRYKTIVVSLEQVIYQPAARANTSQVKFSSQLKSFRASLKQQQKTGQRQLAPLNPV